MSDVSHDKVSSPAIESGHEEKGQRGESSGAWKKRFLGRLKEDRPLPSKKHLYCMIFVVFLVMFIVGWSDASQGPLLPLLQAYYNVNYIVISLIWIAIAVGVIAAAVSNVFLADRLGFGILTPLGASVQAFAYCLMCWGGPYPLFVIAYLFVGLGIGWQDAQVNSLIARVPNATTVMFLAHAIYGLGATVSPFVSTAFVQRVPDQFYLYFVISLALALATVVALVITFKGRTENQVVGKRGASLGTTPNASTPQVDSSEAGTRPEGDEAAAVGPTPAETDGLVERESSAKLKAILVSPRAYFLAFYIFLYMGVEVTIGGWATTFLIEERSGNDSSGYVTSGFFGGLTVGRIILIPVTNWLGHRTSVYIYTLVAIGLEFVIWFVPSLLGSALCFSFVGVALGPMYPSCVMIVTEIMPHDLHTGTIGFLACLGVTGSALMPFVTGAIANSYGVWVLQPLLIAFLAVSIGLWTLVARATKAHN